VRNKEKAFLHIYESNKDRVYRICHYYVSRDDLVNDLFQEIFTNVWKNLESFRGDANINTWIYRIAINTSLNYTRVWRRESSQRGFSAEIDAENPIDQEESREDLELRISLLHKSIEQLSLVERTIISLVIEDLSYKEISRICKMNEGTVRVRVHRIKRKLKHIMKGNLNGF
jgi:RNA polymerase sigma-70 factor (ECF subfamily)